MLREKLTTQYIEMKYEISNEVFTFHFHLKEKKTFLMKLCFPLYKCKTSSFF